MTRPTVRALVVEPDEEYAALMAHLLRHMGADAELVPSDQAVGAAAGNGFAVALVDASAEAEDGRSVLRHLRENATLPIIALSDPDGSEVVVRRAMEHADYELTRPFSPRRFRAAIRAVTRRGRVNAPPAVAQNTLTLGPLSLDHLHLEARLGDTHVTLSPREFSLLYVLAAHPGIALTRDELAIQAWGWHVRGDSRAVDNIVRRLRQKLGDQARSARLVVTVPGVGYRIDVP